MTKRPNPADASRFEIGAAAAEDIPAVLALYNREIREGTALWNTRERTLAEMAAWAEERQSSGYAVLTARRPQACAGEILGYGALGPFRPHDGYALTVEHSLYVDPAAQRQGIGRQLLAALEAAARARGAHVMIGAAEAGNIGSIALHRAVGFTEAARLREVGRKFDRWLTLVLLQKVLSTENQRPTVDSSAGGA